MDLAAVAVTFGASQRAGLDVLDLDPDDAAIAAIVLHRATSIRLDLIELLLPADRKLIRTDRPPIQVPSLASEAGEGS